MTTKSNRNIIMGIVATVVALVVVIVAVSVLKNKRDEGGDNSGSDGGSATSQIKYTDIDTKVEYGDYDTMYTIAKSIQNGEMVGKVVRIDGIVSHPMSKYSIVEADANGGTIGTEFEIEGAGEEMYPSDGDHVVVTGEVVEKSPMYFIIKTSPEHVEVVDIEGDDELEVIEEPEGTEELEETEDLELEF